MSERERERARSHLFFFVRSARTDHLLRTRPRVAHARIFLCENRTRREKKKFQKNWREREIDFGLRVPRLFQRLSLCLSSGSGNKNKKHGRVRCVYRVVVFLLRSFLFGSRKIVRSSRGERFRKPKARFLRLLFSFLFSPRDWA